MFFNIDKLLELQYIFDAVIITNIGEILKYR